MELDRVAENMVAAGDVYGTIAALLAEYEAEQAAAATPVREVPADA